MVGNGLGPVPDRSGGPGHEEVYWLRRKLNESIKHLRDIEDYYRIKGGTPRSYNMIRADRARSLYEQISEDFLNGKTNRPTMRERAEAAEYALEYTLETLWWLRMALSWAVFRDNSRVDFSNEMRDIRARINDALREG